jgi:hypothetical protein
MNNEQLLRHQYANETMIEVPGKLLTELLMFSNAVLQNEQRTGLAYQFSKQSSEVKVKLENGETHVSEVKEELVPYSSAEAFFAQEPKSFVSMLGAGAEDLYLKVASLHKLNIEKGLTVEMGKLTPQETTDEVKLS